MSSAIQLPMPPKTRDPDPFRFGWRDVRVVRPDGVQVTEQIPLTMQDLIHPRPGDVIVENTVHNRDRRYLADVYEAQLETDTTALVLSDTGVYWDHPELSHHSPDIAVILGLKVVKDYYPSFFVAKEGVRPKLIVELVSPDSRTNDTEVKLDHYHRVRVPLYVIVDRLRDEGPPRILGYRYTQRRYVPLPTDEQGRLWLEFLGLWLGVKENRVVCYDGETEEELGDYKAVTRALEKAEADLKAERERAIKDRGQVDSELMAERTRADAAETRARELEAELAQLRATIDSGSS